jgi:hypothetical protein
MKIRWAWDKDLFRFFDHGRDNLNGGGSCVQPLWRWRPEPLADSHSASLQKARCAQTLAAGTLQFAKHHRPSAAGHGDAVWR